MKYNRMTSTKLEDQYFNEISNFNNQLVNLQRELAKKNAELEKVNEFKNLFLGMVVHDLRNPLSAIYTYSQFLLDDTSDITTEQKYKFFENIKLSSELMLSMVEELLHISEIEADKLKLTYDCIDIVALIEKNLTINRVLAKGKLIDINFHSNTPLLKVALDSHKIEQVLNNLISNAIKFSNPGDTIEIELYIENRYIVIAVNDKGIGIPENELKRLFNPFGRTSSRSTHGEKNTGLGLYIVNRIIEEHGGKIEVYSRVGKGSRFLVYLPNKNLNSIPNLEKPEKNEAVIAVSREPLNILIVDDSKVSSMATDFMLKELGHHGVNLSSGEDALNMLQHQNFDIILLDVELSGMDGLTVSRHIRKMDKVKGQNTYIIGISAHSTEQYRKDCFNAGMDDYITKPFSKRALSHSIRKYEEVHFSEQDQKPNMLKIDNQSDFEKVLLKTFFHEYTEKKKEIEIGIDNSDLGVIKKISHTWKSSLSYIGARKASELAAKLEVIDVSDTAIDMAKILVEKIDTFKKEKGL